MISKERGAIIAMAAPPDAWLTSWPSLPELNSVQLVYVNTDGSPTVDRGLTKRTYAPARDTVVVMGCPLLEQTSAPIDVAEGLADALALASRSPAPAVATLGTSGMSSTIIAQWLATSPSTQVWADRDESKEGRAPPGQRHGRGARAPSERQRRQRHCAPHTISAQGPRRPGRCHGVQPTQLVLAGLCQDPL